MADKIQPEEIAAKTGLTVDQVESVLRELMGSWLFSNYVEWSK